MILPSKKLRFPMISPSKKLRFPFLMLIIGRE